MDVATADRARKRAQRPALTHRARSAALVAGSILVVGGLAFVVGSVRLLSCADPFACRANAGSGSALLFVSVPMLVIGIAALVQTARRPVDDADGSGGWIIVLAGLALLGAIVWAVSIKTSWCPPGSRQLRLFAICWRPSGDRFPPESRLAVKWLVGASGLLVGGLVVWLGVLARPTAAWARWLWAGAVLAAAGLSAAGIAMVMLRLS